MAHVINQLWPSSKTLYSGCGGGLVVSVLAFYSDDPSSIPAEVHNFSVNCCWTERNEQKEAKVGPFFKPKIPTDFYFLHVTST